MAVRCEASNAGSDIRCCVCGQGFLIHWASESAEEQAMLRARIAGELRRQHAALTDHPAAHPGCCFTVTDESEPEPLLAPLFSAEPHTFAVLSQGAAI